MMIIYLRNYHLADINSKITGGFTKLRREYISIN